MDKVHAPVLVGGRGRCTGPRCKLIRLRRRTRILTCRPSRRYRRCTRLRLIAQPSRRSSTWMRKQPKRGRFSAGSRTRVRNGVWSFAWLRRYQVERRNTASRHACATLAPKRSRIQCASSRRRAGFRLFSQHLLPNVAIERQIGHDTLEPCVLLLEHAQLAAVTPRWLYFFFHT